MPAVVLDELVDAVLSYVRELVLGLLPGQGPSDREDGTAFAHGLLVFVARARRVGCASQALCSMVCVYAFATWNPQPRDAGQKVTAASADLPNTTRSASARRPSKGPPERVLA